MNLSALTARSKEQFGFDLSDSEFCDLYNEGRREFARRTKYPRKNVEVGPTVAGQAAYDWPTDLLLPLSVSLGGTPIAASDKETVERYEQNQIGLLDNAVWYEKPDEEGVRKLIIYPTPGEVLSLLVEEVFRPVDLSVSEPSGEPTEIPEEFHAHPLYYVAGVYYRTVEDNPELGQLNEQAFDLRVSELVRYDNQRRAGNGVFRVSIAGITG